MNVTGGTDRFIELFTKRNDFSVQITKILLTGHIRHFVTVNHKMVIAKGLNLKIIVKIHDSCNLIIRPFLDNCPKQFARFTG